MFMLVTVLESFSDRDLFLLAFLSGSKTLDGTTRIIIADPLSNILFESDNEFMIENISAIDINGNVVKVNMLNLPSEFRLSSAYPNPFNPSTTLDFELPIATDVSIVIYNLQGQVVSTLIEGTMELGYHSIVWDATQYASGVYLIQFIAGEFSNTQKLMLIK